MAGLPPTAAGPLARRDILPCRRHSLHGVGSRPTFLLGFMKNDFLLAIGQLAAEKNLAKDVVFEAVEAALTSAYRREGADAPNIYVKIDAIGGDIRAYRQMVV